MNLKLFVVGLLLSPFFTVSSPAQAVVSEVRVLDLNICGAVCRNGETAYTGIYIRTKAQTFGANIITLQEVCSSQHTAIQKALGPYWHGIFKKGTYSSKCQGSSKKHGMSVFTLGKHTDARWWLLPHADPDTNRAWWLLCVKWRGFNICTTHIRAFTVNHPPLPGQLPYLIKREQTYFARAIIQSFADPTVWAGDFNQQPGSVAMQTLYATSGWREADQADNESTVDGSPVKIDYVWGTKFPDYVWGNTIGSAITDHRIYYAILRY